MHGWEIFPFWSLNRSSLFKLFHAEQQEQLKLIYEKFKEEVDQHLQDCRSTFEGLEADQLEFKGNMEKQSTSMFVASYIYWFSNTVWKSYIQKSDWNMYVE